jgi:hypothetical protein
MLKLSVGLENLVFLPLTLKMGGGKKGLNLPKEAGGKNAYSIIYFL